MIVDNGLLGTEAEGASSAATATASSLADDSWSSSSHISSGSSSSGAGSVEGSLQSVMAGCGTTAGQGGGAPSSSSSSVVVVRGDLTSTNVAAEIKSFAAAAATCSLHDDGDIAATSLLSIFHLASVMSGHAENDSDEALRVNVDGEKSGSVDSSSQAFSFSFFFCSGAFV